MRRVTERTRSILFDLLVAAGVAGLATLGLVMNASPRATIVVLGFAMAGAVVFRRRRPLATMAAVSAAALLQVVLFPGTYDVQPYDVAVLVAMYSVVKYAKHMRDAYLAAFVVAIGIAIEVLRLPELSLFLPLSYLAVCGGVWLMGYSMRNRRIYVATLEEKAATLEREREHLARIAVADERATIARELHDVVAHSLSVMIVQADGGRYAFDNDPDLARQALRTVAEAGREALEDMRRLVEVLRGTQIEPDGADTRVAVTLDRLDPLVERARSAGVAVEVSVTGERPLLPPAVEVSLYRIVQEALTNVLRHAGTGTHVLLHLRYSAEAVAVSVVDDGGGNSGSRETGKGHGLIGMRERVNVHCGELTAGPNAAGWAVEATIPLRAAEIAV